MATPPPQDRYEVNLELVAVAGTEYAMQANLAHYEDGQSWKTTFFAFCLQSLT